MKQCLQALNLRRFFPGFPRTWALVAAFSLFSVLGSELSQAAWGIPGANPCNQWREIRALRSVASRRRAPSINRPDPRDALNAEILKSLRQFEAERDARRPEQMNQIIQWEEHYRAECSQMQANHLNHVNHRSPIHAPGLQRPVSATVSPGSPTSSAPARATLPAGPNR